ncbi:MAG: hypothetical protein WA021_02635 [Minisyncoccia bacterium]
MSNLEGKQPPPINRRRHKEIIEKTVAFRDREAPAAQAHTPNRRRVSRSTNDGWEGKLSDAIKDESAQGEERSEVTVQRSAPPVRVEEVEPRAEEHATRSVGAETSSDAAGVRRSAVRAKKAIRDAGRKIESGISEATDRVARSRQEQKPAVPQSDQTASSEKPSPRRSLAQRWKDQHVSPESQEVHNRAMEARRAARAEQGPRRSLASRAFEVTADERRVDRPREDAIYNRFLKDNNVDNFEHDVRTMVQDATGIAGEKRFARIEDMKKGLHYLRSRLESVANSERVKEMNVDQEKIDRLQAAVDFVGNHIDALPESPALVRDERSVWRRTKDWWTAWDKHPERAKIIRDWVESGEVVEGKQLYGKEWQRREAVDRAIGTRLYQQANAASRLEMSRFIFQVEDLDRMALSPQWVQFLKTFGAGVVAMVLHVTVTSKLGFTPGSGGMASAGVAGVLRHILHAPRRPGRPADEREGLHTLALIVTMLFATTAYDVKGGIDALTDRIRNLWPW